MDLQLEAKLLTYLREKHGEGFAERLRYRMGLHFRSLPLENHSVLEIGAGSGYLSVFCVARGASSVVALEPQAAGSSNGIQVEFTKMSASLRLMDLVDYRHDSFEQFAENYGGESFDYILMWNVINHLDEKATTRLHLREARTERAIYISNFKKMYQFLNTHGVLIASDVARHNFWNSIGIKFFISPSIEWHKHQQPKVWGKLLAEAGFDSIDIKWCTPFRLRKFAFLLSWKLPTYFLNSAFIITAGKSK